LPARLEACVKLSYDLAGFGDAGEDFVKIIDVKLSDEAGLVGDFNIGIARKPYLFATGDGPLAVLDWSPEKMPRDRWIHFRVDLRHAAPAEAQVFVDRELVTEGSIPPPVRPPTKAVVTPGPLPNGTHPPTQIELAQRRLTRH
jgi:hypothetical protein